MDYEYRMICSIVSLRLVSLSTIVFCFLLYFFLCSQKCESVRHRYADYYPAPINFMSTNDKSLWPIPHPHSSPSGSTSFSSHPAAIDNMPTGTTHEEKTDGLVVHQLQDKEINSPLVRALQGLDRIEFDAENTTGELGKRESSYKNEEEIYNAASKLSSSPHRRELVLKRVRDKILERVIEEASSPVITVTKTSPSHSSAPLIVSAPPHMPMKASSMPMHNQMPPLKMVPPIPMQHMDMSGMSNMNNMQPMPMPQQQLMNNNNNMNMMPQFQPMNGMNNNNIIPMPPPNQQMMNGISNNNGNSNNNNVNSSNNNNNGNNNNNSQSYQMPEPQHMNGMSSMSVMSQDDQMPEIHKMSPHPSLTKISVQPIPITIVQAPHSFPPPPPIKHSSPFSAVPGKQHLLPPPPLPHKKSYIMPPSGNKFHPYAYPTVAGYGIHNPFAGEHINGGGGGLAYGQMGGTGVYNRIEEGQGVFRRQLARRRNHIFMSPGRNEKIVHVNPVPSTHEILTFPATAEVPAPPPPVGTISYMRDYENELYPPRGGGDAYSLPPIVEQNFVDYAATQQEDRVVRIDAHPPPHTTNQFPTQRPFDDNAEEISFPNTEERETWSEGIDSFLPPVPSFPPNAYIEEDLSQEEISSPFPIQPSFLPHPQVSSNAQSVYLLPQSNSASGIFPPSPPPFLHPDISINLSPLDTEIVHSRLEIPYDERTAIEYDPLRNDMKLQPVWELDEHILTPPSSSLREEKHSVALLSSSKKVEYHPVGFPSKGKSRKRGTPVSSSNRYKSPPPSHTGNVPYYRPPPLFPNLNAVPVSDKHFDYNDYVPVGKKGGVPTAGGGGRRAGEMYSRNFRKLQDSYQGSNCNVNNDNSNNNSNYPSTKINHNESASTDGETFQEENSAETNNRSIDEDNEREEENAYLAFGVLSERRKQSEEEGQVQVEVIHNSNRADELEDNNSENNRRYIENAELKSDNTNIIFNEEKEAVYIKKKEETIIEEKENEESAQENEYQKKEKEVQKQKSGQNENAEEAQEEEEKYQDQNEEREIQEAKEKNDDDANYNTVEEIKEEHIIEAEGENRNKKGINNNQKDDSEDEEIKGKQLMKQLGKIEEEKKEENVNREIDNLIFAQIKQPLLTHRKLLVRQRHNLNRQFYFPLSLSSVPHHNAIESTVPPPNDLFVHPQPSYSSCTGKGCGRRKMRKLAERERRKEQEKPSSKKKPPVNKASPPMLPPKSYSKKRFPPPLPPRPRKNTWQYVPPKGK